MRPLPLIFVCLLGLLGVSLLGACRPAPVDCLVPDARTAIRQLEGVWTIALADGTVDGEMHFRGANVETRWDDVTLFGRWEALGAEGNRYRILLTISEARHGQVQQRFGRLDELVLELVYMSPNALVALQADGAWTWWRRQGAESAP